MTSSPRGAQLTPSLGDSAVDGLLAGTGAGVLMGVYVAVAGVLSGQSLSASLAQFDPSARPSPVTGVLAHLAVAGVYGVIFAVAWRGLRLVWTRIPAWVAGLLYSVGLWALALALLRLPAATISAGWLAQVTPLHLAVAHLVFGAALGWLLGRRRETA